MKNLILALLLLPFCSHSQNSYTLDSIGMDDSYFLNHSEINYTKHLLTYHYSELDFVLDKKKILFLTSTHGSNKVSKSAFFEKSCIPWTLEEDMPQIFIIELTADEVQKIGSDIILVAWPKIIPEGKARKKVIKNALKNL